MNDDKPTLAEALERSTPTGAMQLALYAPMLAEDAQTTGAENGWEAIGWIKDEIFTWGNPEPVRQDYYFAIEDEINWISYETLALIFGKPQKKDYGRARDFRAARRRYARWKKGKP